MGVGVLTVALGNDQVIAGVLHGVGILHAVHVVEVMVFAAHEHTVGLDGALHDPAIRGLVEDGAVAFLDGGVEILGLDGLIVDALSCKAVAVIQAAGVGGNIGQIAAGQDVVAVGILGDLVDDDALGEPQLDDVGLAVAAVVGIAVNAILPGKDYSFSGSYSNGKPKRK